MRWRSVIILGLGIQDIFAHYNIRRCHGGAPLEFTPPPEHTGVPWPRKLGITSVDCKRREDQPDDDEEEDLHSPKWDSPWPPGYWQRAEEARANGT